MKITRVLGSVAAAASLATGLVVSASLLASTPVLGNAGASATCGSYALLVAHADGTVNEETPSGCNVTAGVGSLSGHLNAPIVGIAATPDGGGYWLVASDGGVFTFGDAQYYGSMGGQRLNAPIVGIAPTANGGGYWLVASDGGIFTFGNAQYWGSTGADQLVAPIVGMTADPETGGYWLVASDGGVFSFNAPYLGSMGGQQLAAPIRFIESTPDGHGYRLVGSDGGVFDFGDAQFYGSGAGLGVPSWQALSPTPDNGGYWLVTNDTTNSALTVASFGDAPSYPVTLSTGNLTSSPVVGAATFVPGQFQYIAPTTVTPVTSTPEPQYPGTTPYGSAPVVTQSPQPEDVPTGGTATFTAAASGNPVPFVQWQVSLNEGGSYNDIANATSNTLTFQTVQSESGGLYRAVFTNQFGAVATTPVVLTVGSCDATTTNCGAYCNIETTNCSYCPGSTTYYCNTAGLPVIITQPQSQELPAGSTASFTAEANNASSVQWYVSYNSGGTWEPISGATSPTLAFQATPAVNDTEYDAVFTNSYGNVDTQGAFLQVISANGD